MLVLLYSCITWTNKMFGEKKLDENYTRTLYAVFKQILEAAADKTAVASLLTSHDTNHPIKMKTAC